MIEKWWTHVITVAALALVMGWVARRRKAAKVEGRARVLTNPAAVWIIGVLSTTLFVGVAMLSIFMGTGRDWLATCIFLGFALLGVPLIIDGFRVRHELKDGGIAYRGLVLAYDRVLWNELESAAWSNSMKWLVLTTWDGRKLRFSGLLNGLDSLALALAEHAPRLRMNDRTAKVLADARQGILPNIWQN